MLKQLYVLQCLFRSRGNLSAVPFPSLSKMEHRTNQCASLTSKANRYSSEQRASDHPGHKGGYRNQGGLSNQNAQHWKPKAPKDCKTPLSYGDTTSIGSVRPHSAVSLPGHVQYALGKDTSCFDICRVEKKAPVKLNSSLFRKNRERRNELAQSCPQIKELRPGMILLKSFISEADQVEIVKRCRTLGVGVGGFYQPGYGDGRKLRLQMMCLGKNWEPQTRLYTDIRSIDGAKPPSIPNMFRTLVEEAIEASHAYYEAKHPKIHSVEEILPRMSPDLCIVNFYTNSGKLGLHQDRDESPESIEKALPIVSFSIGDSADFAFSENRDEDSAANIVLESGDVILFGGKSRLIFHGVPKIHSGTAPEQLLEETNLRPGRLNLTFRQY